MDIWNLKEKDLRNCSLGETIDIIDEISRIVTEQHGNIQTEPDDIIKVTEMSDDLYSKITALQNKILEDAFNEQLPRNWKLKKEGLLSKLFSVIIVVQNIRDSARVWLSINESNKHFTELEKAYQALVEDYDEKKSNLELHIEKIEEATKKTLNEQTGVIKTTSKETLEEIQGAEGKIVSHVLTLMGVFSAVITIILSIVVTSSSWLNNATNSSAIVAFIVPNMVTLFAVISVVLLVFMYHKAFYPPVLKQNQSASKAPTIISTILLSAILLITILVSVLACRYAEVDNKPHLRYVIHDANYNIVEITDLETDVVYKYFEFNFDGQNIQFLYDEKYLHESDIYFCSEHNTLE
jgi:hypothetical protein